MTDIEWRNAPWTLDKCERCDGLGTIEVEPYGRDWDDYDD